VVEGEYFNVTASLASFGFHLERASYPIGVVEYLKAHDFHGRVFCDSYDGGYVEYQMPQVEIAGDSYFSNVPMTLKFFSAIKDPAALTALDSQLGFDALIINVENLEVIQALEQNPTWNLVYIDSHR
jgi:hypothetical protein